MNYERQANRTDQTSIEWFGLRQATHYASVCGRTLRSWLHSPTDPLPAVRVGGKILIKRTELEAWLERHRIKPFTAVDVDGIVKTVLGARNGL
ncbi:MAG: helix-turn-helix domain-containing protein [Bryobacteraceae bacterium]